ncbi:MAG: ATP-binding protein [Caulobacter sp.]
MLLRFGCANYFSFRRYTEIVLTASRGIKDKGPDLLSTIGAKQPVLPVVLIYGANAAGKTTLFLALDSMRNHVVNSYTKLGPDDDVPNTPFALDGDGEDIPSKFDCDFIIEGVRYHYGFEILHGQFSDEWLYYFPSGNRRMLFHRPSEVNNTEFGPSFKGSKKGLLSIARTNSLLVSAGAQAKSEQLGVVYSFFRDKLVFIGPNFSPASATAENSTLDHRVAAFLAIADTGIVSARVEMEETSEGVRKAAEAFMSSLVSMGQAPEDVPPMPTKIPSIYLTHRSANNGTTELPLSVESRGTIRIISLMSKILSAIDFGKTVVIDEIDASLHTLLSIEIVKLFSNSSVNVNGAQLIATTHDTNLLCSELIRRDQVWFAEKSDEGETSLFPLTDIKTRNSDNIEKGYLQGRYGAIPFFGRVDSLFDRKQQDE